MNQRLFEGNREELPRLTEEALAAGVARLEVLEEGLIAGMRVVGEDFKYNRIFVPEVLLAAREMKAAMVLLQPLLTASGEDSSAGTIILGTVKEDLHDIGKNLVGMMSEGAGFTVVDLGTNTAAEEFVAAVREHDALPLGMSALSTTTMVYMKTVVDAMKEADLGHVAICVGGAPISQSYADAIGADGYAADAGSAVELFKRLAASRLSA